MRLKKEVLYNQHIGIRSINPNDLVKGNSILLRSCDLTNKVCLNDPFLVLSLTFHSLCITYEFTVYGSGRSGSSGSGGEGDSGGSGGSSNGGVGTVCVCVCACGYVVLVSEFRTKLLDNSHC